MADAAIQEDTRSNTGEGKILCVVSGKGGSGKTLITSLIGTVAAGAGKVLLVDADFGTGGLTYFLTFKTFDRGTGGFCEIMREDIGPDYIFKFSKPRNTSQIGGENIELLPIGDHKRFHLRKETVDDVGLAQFIKYIRKKYDFIVFDCRGGIDDESVAISRLCDEIILIVETDAASIRASQHLREVLEGEELEAKVRGFIINKVMDNPEQLSELYSSILFSDYLGSVPFDIEANKAFIKGEFPEQDSRFYQHCRHITGLAIDEPKFLNSRLGAKVWTSSSFDYGNAGSRKGRILLLVLSIYCFGIFYMSSYLGASSFTDELLSQIDQRVFGILPIILIFLMTSDRLMETIGNAAFRVLRFPFGRRR